MKLSQVMFRSLRAVPADVESISHNLLLRAGFIQQIAAGIFSYLPFGWRAIQKVKSIVREEMNAAGAYEVRMPVVQPRSLWEESGRAQTFRPPLASFEDRRAGRMVLAPTHEEAVVMMGRLAITSYRDLPLNVFQIQTKFRDEIRSRGGLLRVREFEMKDAYSFDVDQKGLDTAFNKMASAYRNIFRRCGLATVEAEADSGGIGGSESKEFISVAENGEDSILICQNDGCNYVANAENAEFRKEDAPQAYPQPLTEFATPDIKTIRDLCEFAKVPTSATAKAVFYETASKELVLVIVRGDYKINDVKLGNLLNSAVAVADPQIVSQAGYHSGYVSPVAIKPALRVVADDSVTSSPNLIGGANKVGYHLRNINIPRDYKPDLVGDIALAEEGYRCVRCGSELAQKRGIEVGHIFKLGTLYSKKMNFQVPDGKGNSINPFMGCYGIGMGRLLAAAIEANHDQDGMCLPAAIAPYEVVVIGLNLDISQVAEKATNLYNDLKKRGCDVLFDDRPVPPGVKFKDMELVGIPVRVVVSKRGLENGTVEIKERRGTTVSCSAEDVPDRLKTDR